MKNIVYILVDAFYSEALRDENLINKMPYFNSLMENSYYFNNVFSLAPYTEAALISTLGGERTLENGEYFNALNNCDNFLFEYLNKNGYYVYSTFAPYLQPSSFIRGVNDYVYVRPFNFKNLLLYRINYMSDKHKKTALSLLEKNKLYMIIHDSIQTALDFYTNIFNSKENIKLIEGYIEDVDIADIIKKIAYELKKLEENRDCYIEDLLNKKEKHSLFQIELAEFKFKNSKTKTQYINPNIEINFQNESNRINKIVKKNKKINYFQLNSIFLNNSNINALSKVKTYLNTYKKSKTTNSFSEFGYNFGKVTLSAKTVFDFMEEKIIQLEKKEKNYCAYIHIEDFHSPSSFISYDSDDIETINEEIEDAIKFMKTVDDNYSKNIVSDLSLHYIDKKINNFINKLSKNLEKETVFVITGDHGYSFSYNPIRESTVNNFYKENYHVPLFIFENSQSCKMENSRLFNTFDINSTILPILGIKNHPFSGMNMLSSTKGREMCLIEYLGPGCPDILNKDIFYSAFDEDYKVGVKIKLNDNDIFENIVDIYDLKNDPNELYNKKYRKKKLKSKIYKYVLEINKRHKYLQEKILFKEEK